MDESTFHYAAACSSPGCGAAPVQDRRPLEPRAAPRAEELRPGLRAAPRALLAGPRRTARPWPSAMTRWSARSRSSPSSPAIATRTARLPTRPRPDRPDRRRDGPRPMPHRAERSSPSLLIARPRPAPPPTAPAAGDPFARFDLPDAWEARFWGEPRRRGAPGAGPEGLADLVPTQAGLRFCRCPGCDATEADDPLGWSIRKPEVVTCKRCGASFPNDKIPAPGRQEGPRGDRRGRPGRHPPLPVSRGRGREAALPRRAALPRGQARLRGPRVPGQGRPLRGRPLPRAAARPSPTRPSPGWPACSSSGSPRSIPTTRSTSTSPASPSTSSRPTCRRPTAGATGRPSGTGRGASTSRSTWSSPTPWSATTRRWPRRASCSSDPTRRGRSSATCSGPRPSSSADQPEEFDERSLQADRGMLAVGRLLGRRGPGRARRPAGSRGSPSGGSTTTASGGRATRPAHRRVLGELDGWIDRLLPGVGRAVDGRRPPRCRCWPWPGRPARRS